MSANVAPNVVRNGLVLDLDAANQKSYPGTGTGWSDLTPNGNNGTLTNGPTFNSANGGSIVFDGVDDSVICTSNSTIDLTGSSITLMAWVYQIGSTAYKQIFAKASGTGATQRQYGLYIVGAAGTGPVDSLGFEIRTNNGRIDSGSGQVTYNQWQHVAGVYDGSKMYFYINGAQVGNVSQTGNITTQASNLYIGQFSVGNFSTFNGRISCAQIYNRALSSAEVLQNYNSQKSRFGL